MGAAGLVTPAALVMEHQPGAVAVIHRGDNAMKLTELLVGAWMHGLVPKGTVFVPVQGGAPAFQRNLAIRWALEARPDLAWLWFMDSDQSAPPTILLKLLEVDAPLVSGVVLQRWFPYAVAAFQSTEPVIPVRHEDVPLEGTLKVAAVGTGCLLIRRPVLDALGPTWFRCGQMEPDKVQEDIDFTMRAAAAGFQAVLRGDARVLHRTEGWVSLGADGRPWMQPLATELIMHPINVRREPTR